MALPKFGTLLLERVKPRILLLTLNRPKQFNATNPQVFHEWTRALRWAAKDEETDAVCVTGKGKVYSAGMSMDKAMLDQMNQPRKESADVDFTPIQPALDFVSAVIEFPKLLVAAINGPTFGIGVTTLPLFDLVYSVEDAFYKTPFAELGICAEGCSSDTFPRYLGLSLTSRFLHLSETIQADELHRAGLIQELLEASGEEFVQEVIDRVASHLKRVSSPSIIANKALIRHPDEIARLNAVNYREMHQVAMCLGTAECRERIGRFINRRSKSSDEQAKL